MDMWMMVNIVKGSNDAEIGWRNIVGCRNTMLLRV